MSFEGEQGVVPAHTGTVIGHTDEAAAAGTDLDGDLLRAGIEGIFDEFLHDAGGAFDDLAGRDLVRDLLGKEFYSIHNFCRAGKFNHRWPRIDTDKNKTDARAF